MRRDLGDGYVLDDDRARVDIDVVHSYISGESYWGRGRSREMIATALANSHRLVGLYHGAAQVGFARIVSDGVTVAYLCDVFVLDAHRGHGLGVELVREAVGGAGVAGLKWMLHTADAHELYRRFGFDTPNDTALERMPG
jgi:GNAT superfamily N-acetyltransferase